jgi:hypothetical protein
MKMLFKNLKMNLGKNDNQNLILLILVVVVVNQHFLFFVGMKVYKNI